MGISNARGNVHYPGTARFGTGASIAQGISAGGGSRVLGMVASAVANGKALADDGEEYDTVQAAENAASNWVLVAPGTFNESVTVDTADLTIFGSGRDTLINGGTSGDAILVQASGVSIINLSVQTSSGQGNSIDGIATGTGCDILTISNVWVIQSDDRGIRLTVGGDHKIIGCMIEASDFAGVDIGCDPRVVVHGVTTQSISNGIVLTGTADDCVVSNCSLFGDGTSTNGDGINVNSPDNIVAGNVAQNFNRTGIRISGGSTDSIIANNRLADSGTDLNDSGTSTTLDNNVTGASN